jgi:hypothetical protein
VHACSAAGFCTTASILTATEATISGSQLTGHERTATAVCAAGQLQTGGASSNQTLKPCHCSRESRGVFPQTGNSSHPPGRITGRSTWHSMFNAANCTADIRHPVCDWATLQLLQFLGVELTAVVCVCAACVPCSGSCEVTCQVRWLRLLL